MDFRKEHIIFSVRTVARIWAAVILVFVGFMLAAHTFDWHEEPHEGFQSIMEFVTFIFFPIGTLLGLAVALKWEGIGGLMSIISLVGLFIMRPELLGHIMFVGFLAPGLLFILYWYLAKDYKPDEH